MDTQGKRLFDVYALGPFMLWFAVKAKQMPRWARSTLFVSGVMTISYNWDEYKKALNQVENISWTP